MMVLIALSSSFSLFSCNLQVNTGWDGIVLKKGEKYDFSLFTKQLEGKNAGLKVSLFGKNGEVYAQTSTGSLTPAWKKKSFILTPNADATDAKLEIKPQAAGKVAPVNVKTQVKLDNASNFAVQAQRSVLTGKPDGQNLKPVEDMVPISSDFPCELPAYSFTVIRLKPSSK